MKTIRRYKKRRNARKRARTRPSSKDKIQAFYASYEWRKLRYSILVRYGRKCMCCGNEKGVMHVDHIKPLRKNWQLRLDPENMQVLCAVCNHGKGNWDETDFRHGEDNFIRDYVKKYVLTDKDPIIDFVRIKVDKYS